jgi:hypothetical protein
MAYSPHLCDYSLTVGMLRSLVGLRPGHSYIQLFNILRGLGYIGRGHSSPSLLFIPSPSIITFSITITVGV